MTGQETPHVSHERPTVELHLADFIRKQTPAAVGAGVGVWQRNGVGRQPAPPHLMNNHMVRRTSSSRKCEAKKRDDRLMVRSTETIFPPDGKKNRFGREGEDDFPKWSCDWAVRDFRLDLLHLILFCLACPNILTFHTLALAVTPPLKCKQMHDTCK